MNLRWWDQPPRLLVQQQGTVVDLRGDRRQMLPPLAWTAAAAPPATETAEVSPPGLRASVHGAAAAAAASHCRRVAAAAADGWRVLQRQLDAGPKNRRCQSIKQKINNFITVNGLHF